MPVVACLESCYSSNTVGDWCFARASVFGQTGKTVPKHASVSNKQTHGDHGDNQLILEQDVSGAKL